VSPTFAIHFKEPAMLIPTHKSLRITPPQKKINIENNLIRYSGARVSSRDIGRGKLIDCKYLVLIYDEKHDI